MWFLENKERWEKEKENLQASQINFSIDEEVEKLGQLRLNLEITEESDISVPSEFLPLKLIVVFPMHYPFFRPEVYAPDLDLPRHQNKIDKNLCLIPRSSDSWLPEITLMEHLKEQLPKVIAAGLITDPEILKVLDYEQAEPASEYYAAISNAPVIFDPSGFDAMPAKNQPIDLMGTVNLGVPTEAEVPTRIIVLENFDADKNSLNKLPEHLIEMFPSRATGAVYRLQEAPPFGIAEKDYNWLVLLLNESKGFPKFRNSVKLKKGSSIENVVAITFPEEHTPGNLSWGWLFLVAVSIPQPVMVKGRAVPSFKKAFYYAKLNRINSEELSVRIPSLKSLANMKVAVFGLGALGAPSVIEFAKNGVAEITVVDFDTIDSGTIVRWPLGVEYTGLYKTDAIESFLKFNYPYTKIRQFRHKVGAPQIFKDSNHVVDIPSMDEILSNASLIYDATAEIGVSHFLSEEAKKRGIPFISVYGTPGVWGGAIIRCLPENEDSGCWMCYQYALKDGLIPTPPRNRNGDVQAAGCGDISFTGTSFELANLVSSGVRFAMGTLCRSENGYPDIPTDIAVLSLVDDYGNAIFPKWTTHHLNKHPECPYCNETK